MKPNPFVLEILGSFVRGGLQLIAGLMIRDDLLTQADADKYIAPAALALATLAWSWWQKHGMRAKLVTAMAMPAGVSENQVQAAIKNPFVSTPSVTLPKDAVAPTLAKPPELPKAG